MADTDSTPIECGFCLLQDAAMKDPRTMRCGHTHCGSCLSVLWHSMGKIICADNKCRYTSLSDLNGQTHSTSKRHDIWCHSCECRSCASIFCTSCHKGYCGSCQKKHQVLHSDHKTTPVYEYKCEAKKIEERMCTEANHADMELTRGCRCCLSTLCTLCARNQRGEGHAFVDLDDLVVQLKQDVENLAQEMYAKEEELAVLHDEMSNSIREHEAQTEKLIKQLNTARDEQLAAINENYDQLVADFKDRRERSLNKLKEFEETEVTNHWLDLIIGRQKVEAFLKYSHKVDLVKEHVAKLNEVEALLNREMPVLNVGIVSSTFTKDFYRKPEMELFAKQKKICLHNPYKPDDESKKRVSFSVHSLSSSDGDASFEDCQGVDEMEA